MKKEILVGTASWSDPGFVADWYPEGLPASQRLNWYAERLNLVELNSSFYAIPTQKQVEAWCRQTPDRFMFDVKLHKLLSRHSTPANLLPPDLRKLATVRNGKVDPTPALEKAMVKRLLEETSPLRENGKLGAFLLQLSPAFRPKTNQLAELNSLLELLDGHPLAIELRNRDWVTGTRFGETIEFFRKRRITFVSVDAPADEHFTIMPSQDAVTNPELGYMRLHGRNASGYIRGRTVAERFDYKYKEKELQELADRAIKLIAKATKVHMIYNNNSSNYAPIAATRTREILEEEHPQISTGPEPLPQHEVQLAFEDRTTTSRSLKLHSTKS
jgi:uncharacterized protein YecE (DUF72 family)